MQTKAKLHKGGASRFRKKAKKVHVLWMHESHFDDRNRAGHGLPRAVGQAVRYSGQEIRKGRCST